MKGTKQNGRKIYSTFFKQKTALTASEEQRDDVLSQRYKKPNEQSATCGLVQPLSATLKNRWIIGESKSCLSQFLFQKFVILTSFAEKTKKFKAIT